MSMLSEKDNIKLCEYNSSSANIKYWKKNCIKMLIEFWVIFFFLFIFIFSVFKTYKNTQSHTPPKTITTREQKEEK